MRFTCESDGEVATPHPLSKAAFLELGAIWPRWVRVSDLLATAGARVRAAGGPLPTAADEGRLLKFLLGSYGGGVSELRSMECPFVTEVSKRPRASALARLQARSGAPVTNLKHASVRLDDPLVGTFLRLLDGTRDRVAIARDMAAILREAGAAAEAGGLERGLALNFDRVARLALLEG